MYVSIPTIIHSYCTNWTLFASLFLPSWTHCHSIPAVCLFKICPKLSLERGMKKELCEPQMLFQCLSFSPALLALSAMLQFLVSLTSHGKPAQGKLPDTAKLIGCTYLRLNVLPICMHTDPNNSGFSAHGLDRLPLKCSLPGQSIFSPL